MHSSESTAKYGAGRRLTWQTPSEYSLVSMPLGNGHVGANVWATDDGAIHLYLSKTDARDESMRLLKLGELELTSPDAPLAWIRTVN